MSAGRDAAEDRPDPVAKDDPAQEGHMGEGHSRSTAAYADDEDVAETLTGAHRDSHVLWNKRDLPAFIPTFLSTIHYLDVPAGHEITNATQMTTFASKWYIAAPDAKISGVYWFAGRISHHLGALPAPVHPSLEGDLWTVCELTLSGTQTGPLPNGHPPTGKKFSLSATEWISWRRVPPSPESIIPPWRASGGDMYYDGLIIAELGLAGQGS